MRMTGKNETESGGKKERVSRQAVELKQSFRSNVQVKRLVGCVYSVCASHTRTHNVSNTCIVASICMYIWSVTYRKKEHIVSVVHIPYKPDIRMINFQCVQSIYMAQVNIQSTYRYTVQQRAPYTQPLCIKSIHTHALSFMCSNIPPNMNVNMHGARVHSIWCI